MRYDHSDWLIHFVRDRDTKQDFPGASEEEFGHFAGGEVEPDATAFAVLETMLRVGIRAGYSFRSGRTTIYGGKPAICATEMPIYSFAEYVRRTKSEKRVSAFGVAFLKSEFYLAGGRPVIYGLSTDKVTYKTDMYDCRVFNDDVLPLTEQYRYVAYSPAGKKWIDWSHEREWRWISNGAANHRVTCKDWNGCYDELSGLNLFCPPEEGGFFSKIAIIVWTEEDAKQIRKMLTGFFLAESNNYCVPFSRKIIAESCIIVLDKVITAVEVNKELNAQTIEGLRKEYLAEPLLLWEDTDEHDAVIEYAMGEISNAGELASKEFLEKHQIGGYCGFAHVATSDITSPIIQRMIKLGLTSGPFDGILWINFKGTWQHYQCMSYDEYIADRIADRLNEILGNMFYMTSRPD